MFLIFFRPIFLCRCLHVTFMQQLVVTPCPGCRCFSCGLVSWQGCLLSFLVPSSLLGNHRCGFVCNIRPRDQLSNRVQHCYVFFHPVCLKLLLWFKGLFWETPTRCWTNRRSKQDIVGSSTAVLYQLMRQSTLAIKKYWNVANYSCKFSSGCLNEM